MATLRRGDISPEVKLMQEALLAHQLLTEDDVIGTFGPKTERAVKAFQKSHGLLTDGIAGSVTLNKLGLSLTAKELSPMALREAAISLDVPLAILMAFAKVESAGSGFHPNGTIKILYERHIFRRQCRARGLTLLASMTMDKYPNLCNSSTGGYVGGLAENDRLAKAKLIHDEIAAESVSYGKFQLMGFRYEWCGFNSALEMEEHLSRGEDEQLTALVNFIRAQPELHQAIKNLDYPTMASIYNGPKHNGYDILINKAYDEFKNEGY